MEKCKLHPHYYGNKPPKTNCPDCQAMWDLCPTRKINVKRCLCLQCKKRINKPEKGLFNYCYLTKDMCKYKKCQDCLETDEQVIECSVKEGNTDEI